MANKLKLVTLPAVTVTTAGNPVRVSETSIQVFSVTIISHADNTGYQAIGDENVDASAFRGGIMQGNGHYELSPPDTMRATDTIDLKEVFLDSTSNGAVFAIIGWVRG